MRLTPILAKELGNSLSVLQAVRPCKDSVEALVIVNIRARQLASCLPCVESVTLHSQGVKIQAVLSSLTRTLVSQVEQRSSHSPTILIYCIVGTGLGAVVGCNIDSDSEVSRFEE